MIIRSFNILSEAWHADANLTGRDFTEEINITVEKSGGLIGEFAIRWYPIPGEEKPAPKLECFNDGWVALNDYCADFLQALARNASNLSPEIVALMLQSELGFEDVTPRETPHE